LAQPIFDEAFACQARSMQLEPLPDGVMRVHYEIDGFTHQRKTLPLAHGAALTAALKTLAGTPAGAALRPDDGTFTVARDAEQLDFGVTTHLLAFGEQVTLIARGEPLAGGLHREGLAAIGIPWRACESLRAVLKQRSGMLLLAAPPQCGRTTTGYALLGEVSPVDRTVATIEERIDEHLQCAIQSPVDADAGRPFATVLRAVLNRNPDIVFIDEVRDRETAQVAVQAAANRLVIATIRADDAASSFLRLLSLGVDPHFVQETATAALALRLARKLCNACKKPRTPPPEFRQKLRSPARRDLLIYKRNGCDACHRIGYSGRIPITEFLLVDDRVRDLIRSRATSRRIRMHARRAGMQTLRESAIALVHDGVTSIREVVRVVP
jgi:type IV pilus assembly protein PilB